MKTKQLLAYILIFFFGIQNCLAAEKKEGEFDDIHALTDEKHPVDNIPTEVLSKRAFEAIIEELYPTSKDQRRLIKEKELERIDVENENTRPDSLTDIIQVKTSPGALPKEIFVAPLHSTYLNIIDSTGQPWPITTASNANKLRFEVKKIEAHKYKNIIEIVPKYRVGTTNINFSLAGMPTTFSITITSNADKYYPSPIIQLDREGPQAKPIPVFTVQNINDDPVLKDMVLGIAPPEYQVLRSSDGNVEAWRDGGNLYIRTIYLPSAPWPRGIYHGPSGYSAYRMNDLPSITMVTSDGHEKRINFEEADTNVRN